MVLLVQNSVLEMWNLKSHGYPILLVLTLSLLNRIGIFGMFYLINNILLNEGTLLIESSRKPAVLCM